VGRQAADGAAKGTAAAAGRLNGRLRAVEGAAAGRRRSNLEGSAAAALDLPYPPRCAAGCESLRCGEVIRRPDWSVGSVECGAADEMMLPEISCATDGSFRSCIIFACHCKAVRSC